MEERGLNVDLAKLKAMIADIFKEKSVIEAKLKEILGTKGPINFNSSKDVTHILSSTLGVEPKTTKTGRYKRQTPRRPLREADRVGRGETIDKPTSRGLRCLWNTTAKRHT